MRAPREPECPSTPYRVRCFRPLTGPVTVVVLSSSSASNDVRVRLALPTLPLLSLRGKIVSAVRLSLKRKLVCSVSR